MRFEPAASLRGDVAVPGDKSISHRAVLIGAIASGETEARGFGRSADTLSTAAAVAALGAGVAHDGDTVRVRGAGLTGLRSPGQPVDCGNAGTLLRLLAGILAASRTRSSSSATSRCRAARSSGSRSPCARWARTWRRRTVTHRCA
jgi:3-phosphoshikimate 1-carboxyvinyltransferase